jgi:hypothetical protein
MLKSFKKEKKGGKNQNFGGYADKGEDPQVNIALAAGKDFVKSE